MEKKVKSKRRIILEKILLAVECVVIALCLVLSILVISKPGEVGENGAKTKFLPVQTDSMSPTIPVGSLVITQKPSSDVYDLGTIVTFVASENGVNFLDTHRIVGYSYLDSTGGVKIDYYKKGVLENFEDFEKKHKGEIYAYKGYITRGDKFTIEYGSMDDFGYSKDDGFKVTIFDDAITRDQDEIIAVYKTQVYGIGAVLTWFMKPTNFFIVILIPLILLFAYNIYGLVKLFLKNKIDKVKMSAQADEEEIKKRAIEEYLASQKANNVSQSDSSKEESVANGATEDESKVKEQSLENKNE